VFQQICGQTCGSYRVIAEKSYRGVTVSAEQFTDTILEMIMINKQNSMPTVRPRSTYRALSSLHCEHGLIFSNSHAVILGEVISPMLF
jgi:hypothetical protein